MPHQDSLRFALGCHWGCHNANEKIDRIPSGPPELSPTLLPCFHTSGTVVNPPPPFPKPVPNPLHAPPPPSTALSNHPRPCPTIPGPVQPSQALSNHPRPCPTIPGLVYTVVTCRFTELLSLIVSSYCPPAVDVQVRMDAEALITPGTFRFLEHRARWVYSAYAHFSERQSYVTPEQQCVRSESASLQTLAMRSKSCVGQTLIWVHEVRHDQKESGPAELDATQSCFLLTFGCHRGDTTEWHIVWGCFVTKPSSFRKLVVRLVRTGQLGCYPGPEQQGIGLPAPAHGPA